jgi:hypothetical protein
MTESTDHSGYPAQTQLDLEMSELRIQLKKARRSAMKDALEAGFAFYLLGAICVGIYSYLRGLREPDVESLFLGLLVGILILCGIIYFVADDERSSLRLQRERLLSRKRVLQAFQETSVLSQKDQGPASYFDSLVRINVENLAAYYGLVKVQTDKSFAVSVIMGIAGFILIAFGLLSHESTTTVASASGVITEFIAAVFFYLYNRTVRQMKEYHDTLISAQTPAHTPGPTPPAG